MIEFRVLGSLDLRGPEGKELLSVLAQPKRVALLAYLAVATPRGYHRRDKLLGLFWPERDPQHARNALRKALQFLRQSLGEEVLVSRGDEEVGLAEGSLWCDAVAFEAALKAGDAEKAVELYRGGLLDAFFLADAPEFERWLESERQRLADRYAKALESLGEQAESARDCRNAVEWRKRLAAHDPYNSRYALSLMEALAAAGDRGNALQFAQEHERLLREELGMEPDATFLARAEGLRREAGWPVEVPGEAEITAPESEAAGLPKTPGRSPTRRNAIRSAAFTVAVLAVAIAGYAALRALRSGASDTRISSGAREPAEQMRRIAVLPLQYLPPDPEQDYFAEAMTDQLINHLGKIGALEVISRTSAMRYHETEKSIPEIARELGVDAVVEGSVLRAGGRVRITAQLIDGATDRHLWANSYERDFRDILTLQSDIARAIAGAVQVAVTSDDDARLQARAVNSEAHEAYLKATYFIEKARPYQAIEYGEAAIAADSNYAPGYAVLARSYLGLPYFTAGEDPAELWPKARQLAERALQLDSGSLEAQFVQAALLATNDWDWDAAVRELRRIHELEPTSEFAYVFYSVLLAGLGRYDEALEVTREWVRIDPVSPRAVRHLAFKLYFARRYDEAIAQTEECLELDPDFGPARGTLALVYLERGMYEEAVGLGEGMWGGRTSAHAQAWLAYVYARAGHRQQALDVLREIVPLAEQNYVAPPSIIASAYLALGDRDETMRWLDKAIQIRDPELMTLKGEPRWDALRADPRYPDILRRLNLPTDDAGTVQRRELSGSYIRRLVKRAHAT